jgi:hypothetical protein
MPSVRDILSALRAAAVWLLVVSVFLGPAGIGSVSASAIGADACGVLCPCEEPQRAEQDDEHDGSVNSLGARYRPSNSCADEEESAHEHDGESPDETCFDDCSGCAPGVTLATGAVLVVASLASSPELALEPSDAPTTGVCTGVFRPNQRTQFRPASGAVERLPCTHRWSEHRTVPARVRETTRERQPLAPHPSPT